MDAVNYRQLDRVALDRQYNCRATVSDPSAYTAAWEERSAAARASLDLAANIAYGPSPDETLDIFPPRSNRLSPVLIFIHGGYWRAHNKDGSSHVAPHFLSAGSGVVVVNHSLAPRAGLDLIVDQIRRAFQWVYLNLDAFRGDRTRLFVAGHSSGAHLAAMLLTTEWTPASGVPRDPIRAACLMSGLYDLEPVMLSYVNEWLRLDADQAHRHSPLHHLRHRRTDLLVSVSGHDTAEFRRQSAEFFARWQRAGNPGRWIDMVDSNHYSILDAFLDARTELGREFLVRLAHVPSRARHSSGRSRH